LAVGRKEIWKCSGIMLISTKNKGAKSSSFLPSW